MQTNYANEPSLFDRCMTLIDSVFPGCKQMAEQGMKYDAAWADASIPFIVEDHGEVIAHLGLIPLSMTINDKPYKIAALHGICVKPDHRSKGLFKSLMKEALEYASENLDSALLFTDKPNLYTNYGFKVIPESNFLFKLSNQKDNKSGLRKLSFEEPNDFKIIDKLVKSHAPISNKLNIDQNVLLVLNMLHMPLYYSKELNAIVIYTIEKDTLNILHVLSSSQHSLEDIVSQINEKFSKVILHFCPENFATEGYSRVDATPDPTMMILDNFRNEGEHFRYPDLYRC